MATNSDSVTYLKDKIAFLIDKKISHLASADRIDTKINELIFSAIDFEFVDTQQTELIKDKISVLEGEKNYDLICIIEIAKDINKIFNLLYPEPH